MVFGIPIIEKHFEIDTLIPGNGGGKKANEEQVSKIVEAGGGKKITKEVAQAKFEEEKSILEDKSILEEE